MTPLFTISEALHVGWKRLNSNFWFFVFVTLAFGVISMILNQAGGGPAGIDVLARLANLFVSFFAMFTFIRFSFMTARGQKTDWKDIIEFDSKMLGLYLLGALIFSAAQMIGFMLLVIPGIIACIRLGFFGFILIDENIDPIKALKKSWAMTAGYFWPLLGFTFVLCLVNLLGGIAIVIGLLITVPLTILSMGYVYEKSKSALAAAPIETVVVPVESDTDSK